MKTSKKLLIAVLVVIIAGIYYYISLPAFNLHSSDTWFFMIFLLIVLLFIIIFRKKFRKEEIKHSKIVKSLGFAILGLGVIYLIGSLLSSPIINARKYQKLMKVEE